MKTHYNITYYPDEINSYEVAKIDANSREEAIEKFENEYKGKFYGRHAPIRVDHVALNHDLKNVEPEIEIFFQLGNKLHKSKSMGKTSSMLVFVDFQYQVKKFYSLYPASNVRFYVKWNEKILYFDHNGEIHQNIFNYHKYLNSYYNLVSNYERATTI